MVIGISFIQKKYLPLIDARKILPLSRFSTRHPCKEHISFAKRFLAVGTLVLQRESQSIALNPPQRLLYQESKGCQESALINRGDSCAPVEHPHK